MDFNPTTQLPQPACKAAYYDMIVFSPVRWNFKYQRPQYMVSRMAKKRQVLFIELPGESSDASQPAQVHVVNDHITVLQPQCSLPEFAQQLSAYVMNDIVPIGLFYSPSFSPFLETFTFDKVIYDCTQHASPRRPSFDWNEKENMLINEADLILANEQLIYDAKYQQHPDVHCLPDLNEQYRGQGVPTAILDRTAERMEMLIRSCRNYGVLI